MDINLIVVLLTGIASMVVGFVWYGPMLFANIWMKEVGLKESDLKNGPGMGYLYTFLAAMVMGAAVSYLANAMQVTKVTNGAALGLILGVGFVGTSFLSNYVFTQKSRTLFFIDAGYQILIITIAAVIAAYFN